MAVQGYFQRLADVLHQELCADAGRRCARYRAGNPHYDYYQEHARDLTDKLEPLITVAYIIPVVRAVLGEVL